MLGQSLIKAELVHAKIRWRQREDYFITEKNARAFSFKRWGVVLAEFSYAESSELQMIKLIT